MGAWQGDGLTHAGRRAVNEDALVCRDRDGLWAVIDGMGGHQGGEHAAAMVRQSLQAVVLQGGMAHRLQAVHGALQAAHDAICQHAAVNLAGRSMGAVVAVLLLHGEQGGCLWAGDARLYRGRDQQLAQLTRDHSPVQALRDAGELSEQQARAHPRSNLVWRAVGQGEALQLDQLRFDVRASDHFLLTSDGVHDALAPGALTRLSQVGKAAGLLKAALAQGSGDNVSAVLVAKG
ncbi:MAG: PP2C family serine/threonine-protein phosphatase [Alcanivorax sp.]|nr:PP2C family serine/threonine-protein phosphatase [Alcanivorax sp.]